MYSAPERRQGAPAARADRPRAPKGGAQAPRGGEQAPRRRRRPAWRELVIGLVSGIALVLAGVLAWGPQRAAAPLTQADIDAAVLDAFENKTLPSRSAGAGGTARRRGAGVRAGRGRRRGRR